MGGRRCAAAQLVADNVLAAMKKAQQPMVARPHPRPDYIYER
jgi:hypothetical protein